MFRKCLAISRLTTWMSLIFVVVLLALDLYKEIASLHQNGSNREGNGVPGLAFVVIGTSIMGFVYAIQAIVDFAALHVSKKYLPKRKQYLMADSVGKAVLSGTVGAFLLYVGFAWKVGAFGWGNAIPLLLIFGLSIWNTILLLHKSNASSHL